MQAPRRQRSASQLPILLTPRALSPQGWLETQARPSSFTGVLKALALYSYGLYSYGLCSHGLCSCGLCSYGLNRCGQGLGIEAHPWQLHARLCEDLLLEPRALCSYGSIQLWPYVAMALF